MIRLRHMLRIAPSPAEIEGLDTGAAVTFAPMDALADGLGGLDITRTRSLFEVGRGGYNYFRDGDILLAKVTPCFENGKKAIAHGLPNGIGFATSEVHVLRPDSFKIDVRFLLYLLCSEDFRAACMKSMTGAGGLRRVSEAAILDWRPKITRLDAQKSIADFLDRETARIDLLVEKKKRLASIMRERSQSAIEKAVSAESDLSKLGHHVRILPGYAFASSRFSHDEDEIRLLRGANVSPGKIRWDDVVYWPKDATSDLERFQLEVGDIVMGMDRPWISGGIRVSEITQQDVPALLLQRVCKIIPLASISKEFLKLLLSSKKFLSYFEPELTGVSVPHISGDQITGFRFPYLSVPQQVERANMCRRILHSNEAITERVQESISRLQEFRAAHITAAVTGQIDVNAWSKQGCTERRLDRIEEEISA